MIRSIMVPLDGSPFAECALPYARSIARRTGAQIRLVHNHVPTTLRDPNGPLSSEMDDAESRARECAYLEDVVQKVSGAGATADYSLVDGPTADALVGHAAALSADLVVMTTHGRGPLSRFWLGSVADTLVRLLEPPLLLVRPQEGKELDLTFEPPLGRILIALDGTAEAESILEPALALGGTREAEYTLLKVDELAPVFSWKPGFAAQAVFDLTEHFHKETARYLEGVAQRLRIQGARVEIRPLFHTSAAAGILEEADTGYALIALETRGFGGVTRLLLGSVADKVIRGSAVPVLVHRRPGTFKTRGERP